MTAAWPVPASARGLILIATRWRAVRRLGFFVAVAVVMGVASRALVVQELP
jgi:multisubunit Na+/H+ antiporter MnhB subunit